MSDSGNGYELYFTLKQHENAYFERLIHIWIMEYPENRVCIQSQMSFLLNEISKQ